MAEVSGKLYPVGTRHVRVFALNSSGRPAATSPTTPYVGMQAVGGKSVNMTVPEPRKINHSGDDRLLATDILPPLEASSGEVHIARTDYALQALLSGTLVKTVGEAEIVGYATDLQGYEPTVGLWTYQQALDAGGAAGINGLRRWRTVMYPQVKLVMAPHGTDDNAADLVYRMTPNIVTAHLWGTAFTLLADGFTQEQFAEMMTEGQPWLDNWLGNATATVFTLSKTAISTAKMSVFVDGVLTTAGVTKAVGSVTFAAAPATGVNVTVLYEY